MHKRITLRGRIFPPWIVHNSNSNTLTFIKDLTPLLELHPIRFHPSPLLTNTRIILSLLRRNPSLSARHIKRIQDDLRIVVHILIWDRRISWFNEAGDIFSFTEIYTTLALTLHDIYIYQIGLGRDNPFLRRFTFQGKFKIIFTYLVEETSLSQSEGFHDLNPDWTFHSLSQVIPGIYTRT